MLSDGEDAPRAGAAWPLAAPPGVATFGALWYDNLPYRRADQRPDDDISALADGLPLLPAAQWYDRFAQVHLHFFNAPPEWSRHRPGFARPVFQARIYVAHFMLGNDWAASRSTTSLSRRSAS